MICDAHCHLDLMDDMIGFINEIQHSNIGLFAVGTTPKAYSREVQFCKKSRNIYVGLGMHPQLVSSAFSDIQLFKSLFGESYYIGEVGLDFSKEYVQTKKAQIEIFTEIIRLCEQYGGKVVSIHSLKAANTVIDILKKYKRKTNNKYIFHWFTGSIAQLEKAIEIGCYFSINPGMLKTKSGLEIIKKVPLDRILVETDAPFALKVKNMDGIEQELNRIVSKISDVVGQNMCDIVHENSIEVFSRIEV